MKEGNPRTYSEQELAMLADVLKAIEDFGTRASVLEECIEAAAAGRTLPPETIKAARRMFEQMMTLPKWLSFEQLKRGDAPPDSH